VDPFILGMTQSAGMGTGLNVAAGAIAIAAASNNAIKGIYALFFCDHPSGVNLDLQRTGVQSLILLGLLALAGLIPLLWLQ
jgi:hypothetical protein